MLDISEIKLIRTDTTLDLSQKAEKVCLGGVGPKRLKKLGATWVWGSKVWAGLDQRAEKRTAPSVPKWSPTSVLTGPDQA